MKYMKLFIFIPSMMAMTFLVMTLAGSSFIQSHSTISGNYLHVLTLDMTDPGVD